MPLGIDLLPLALWIAVLWLLRGIARSVRDGDPFVGANVQRLRVMGQPPISASRSHFGQTALQNDRLQPYALCGVGTAEHPGGCIRPTASFPGTPLLCGLGLIVLAEVFAHGGRGRED